MATINPLNYNPLIDIRLDDEGSSRFPFTLDRERCQVCRIKDNLLRCGGCKVVSYCSAAHQTTDRPEHKSICKRIKDTREKLERAEQDLRDLSSSGTIQSLPPDVFNTARGAFRNFPETHGYLKARLAAATVLFEAGTRLSVETALNHFLGILHLDRTDLLGVRCSVPAAMLRLDQEQECYDFIMFWAYICYRDKGQFVGDLADPFMDLHGEDPFEPIDDFVETYTFLDLPHLVSLALLKLRLSLDIEAYTRTDRKYNPFTDRPVGELVKAKLKSIGPDATKTKALSDELRNQYKELCRVIHQRNSHFWQVFVDDGEKVQPLTWPKGSLGEAEIAASWCKSSWRETRDAMEINDEETCQYISFYDGPGTTTVPAAIEKLVDKQKGTGRLFSTVFVPSPSTASVSDLFPPTPIADRRGDLRFIARKDKTKVLVFADGVCINNGQSDPRAGWAVVYGPSQTDVVSGRLETKGPFGDEEPGTGIRAELRAAVAALRLADWKEEGFTRVVIGTHSPYVVDGATAWAKGWYDKNWKAASGAKVKNRDLWELFLGEVERWGRRGLAVQLCKVAKGVGTAADSAAKDAAAKDAPAAFRDLVLAPKTTRAGPVRVLELCFGDPRTYDRWFSHVTAAMMKNGAVVERAGTVEAALAKLTSDPGPSIVLVTDAAITGQQKVYERLVDRLRGGCTVIITGFYGSQVDLGQFNRFFARMGVPWRRGTYYTTTVGLRRVAAQTIPARDRLPICCSQSTLFAVNVEPSEALYVDPLHRSDGAAVAWTKVGSGNLGYVGNVASGEGSFRVVMAMCGFRDC